MTGNWHKEDFCGTGNVLFLANHNDVVYLQKLIKLYTYALCTFLFVCYNNKNLKMKNNFKYYKN